MLSDAALVGQTLQSTYLVEEKIAKGGMAWIYRASHKHLGGKVALKILFANHADNSKIRDRFFTEARLQYKLQHPHIVRVLDFIEDQGIVGFALEWCEGGDLEQWAEQQGGKLNLVQLRDIFLPVIDALHYAHESGIIHRDLKPPNILIFPTSTKSPTAKLSDFGIAKILDGEGPTQTGSILGTLHYLAPEQLHDSKHVDRRSDIYALGVILYRLASGRLPFQGDPHSLLYQVITQTPPPLPEVHPSLRPIILRCMEKRPDLRYNDAMELHQALTDLLKNAETLDAEPLPSPEIEEIAFLPTTSSEGIASPKMPLPTSSPVSLAEAPSSQQTSPATPQGPLPTASLEEKHQTSPQAPSPLVPALLGAIVVLLGVSLGFGWFAWQRTKEPPTPPRSLRAPVVQTNQIKQPPAPVPPRYPTRESETSPTPPTLSRLPVQPRDRGVPSKAPTPRIHRPKHRKVRWRSRPIPQFSKLSHPSFVPQRIDIAALHDVAYYNYQKLRNFQKGIDLFSAVCDNNFAPSCERVSFILKNKGLFEKSLAASRKACELDSVNGCFYAGNTAYSSIHPQNKKLACAFYGRGCFHFRDRRLCGVFKRRRCKSSLPFPENQRRLPPSQYAHHKFTGRKLAYSPSYDDVAIIALSYKKAKQHNSKLTTKLLRYACQKGSLFACNKGGRVETSTGHSSTPTPLGEKFKDKLPPKIDMSALLALASAYNHRYASYKNHEKAEALYKKLCNVYKFADGCYHLGLFYKSQRRFALSERAFLRGCHQGFPHACYQGFRSIWSLDRNRPTTDPKHQEQGCALLKKGCFQLLDAQNCSRYKFRCEPKKRTPSREKLRYNYAPPPDSTPLSGRKAPYPKTPQDLGFIGQYYSKKHRAPKLGLLFLQISCQQGNSYACNRLR
ncbi:MAG: protein kinase [Myxococcales bacterium]|nr:protein kinase [Myxococcales bacterium]